MNVLRIKAAVRARDGACVKCGITNAEHKATTGRQLDVHRTTPGSVYSTAPGVCVSICRRCHGPEPRRPHRARILSGEATTRVVSFPPGWAAVLRRLASSQRTTPSRFLIALARDRAEAEGFTNLPETPRESRSEPCPAASPLGD